MPYDENVPEDRRGGKGSGGMVEILYTSISFSDEPNKLPVRREENENQLEDPTTE